MLPCLGGAGASHLLTNPDPHNARLPAFSLVQFWLRRPNHWTGEVKRVRGRRGRPAGHVAAPARSAATRCHSNYMPQADTPPLTCHQPCQPSAKSHSHAAV
jgi:hypothetical protein